MRTNYARLFLLALTCTTWTEAQQKYPDHIEDLLQHGGAIALPKQTYVLHHPIVLRAKTTVACSEGTVITEDSGNTKAAMIQFGGAEIAITGCALRARTSPIVLAMAQGASGSVVNNSFSSTNDAHGIWIDAPGIRNIKIAGNTFNHLAYAICQNSKASDLRGLLIEENIFKEIRADGIELNNPSNLVGELTASDIIIRENRIDLPYLPGVSSEGSGFCIGIAGANNVSVRNNWCRSWHQGIHIEDHARNITIVENHLENDPTSTFPRQDGIWAIDADKVRVEKNTILGWQGDAIRIDYDPIHQVHDLSIVNNKVNSCTGAAVFLAGGSLGPVRAVISDNYFSGCKKGIVIGRDVAEAEIQNNRISTADSCPIELKNNMHASTIHIGGNTSNQPKSDVCVF